MPFKMGPHSNWYYPCEVVLLVPDISLQNKSLLGRNYESLLKVTGNHLAITKLEGGRGRFGETGLLHCDVPLPFFLCVLVLGDRSRNNQSFFIFTPPFFRQLQIISLSVMLKFSGKICLNIFPPDVE